MIKLIIIMLSFIFLLSSCASGVDDNGIAEHGQASNENVAETSEVIDSLSEDTTFAADLDTEQPIDTTSNSEPPYIYDARKQPLADSLASADEIKRVGIRMGRVIVEGNEQLLAFSATDENNCYIVIDSSYVRDDVTLLGTSPVVKYSTDYELIINLDNVYTDETGVPFTVCRFYVYDPAVGYYRAVSDPVEEGPGVYLMEVLVGVWSPQLAEWNPERAPELPPRQPNTVYPESYVYYFTVIF